jgi:flagellar protein FliO/FliZ
MKSSTVVRGVALSGAVMLLHVTTALAADGASAPASSISSGENTPLNLGGAATTHASSGGGSGIVRTIAGLFIVMAVIYGIAWILRRAGGGRNRAIGSGLVQLANLPLGNGRSVALVRAGREVLLVGVAEHGVTPIRTYSEAEAIASGIDLPPDDPRSFDQAERPTDRLLDALRRMTVRS